MKLKPFAEDTDATSELPQLDIRVIAAALERVERQPELTEPDVSPDSAPDWKLADQLAELRDEVASLQAALTESENRYARLTARHKALLQKMAEREAHADNQQRELNQAAATLIGLEQQRAELVKELSALEASYEKSLKEVAQLNRDTAANQLALNLAQQHIERLSSDADNTQRLFKKAVDQRKQRDQLILKQASELKRLRDLITKGE